MLFYSVWESVFWMAQHKSIDWLLFNVKLTVFSAIFMTKNKIIKNMHIVGGYVRLGWVEFSITTEKRETLLWNRFITAKVYCSLESYCTLFIMCMESDVFLTWGTRLRHFIRTSVLGLIVIVFNATFNNIKFISWRHWIWYCVDNYLTYFVPVLL